MRYLHQTKHVVYERLDGHERLTELDSHSGSEGDVVGFEPINGGYPKPPTFGLGGTAPGIELL